MLNIVKTEINISDDLVSKIKWACQFNGVKPTVRCGNLRAVKHTNLAYVEPHRVVVKDKLYIYLLPTN